MVCRAPERRSSTASPIHGAFRAAVLGPSFTTGTSASARSFRAPFTGLLDVWLQPFRNDHPIDEKPFDCRDVYSVATVRSPVNGAQGGYCLAPGKPAVNGGPTTALRESPVNGAGQLGCAAPKLVNGVGWRRTTLLSFIAVVSLALPVRAADPPAADKPIHPSVDGKPSYEPQGATATPKVDAHWDRYHDYTAATQLLQQLAKGVSRSGAARQSGQIVRQPADVGADDHQFQNRATTQSPTSTSRPSGSTAASMPTKSKPAKSCSTRPGICWKCTTTRRWCGDLVDERTFYLMPMMSPDSRDAHFYEPNSTHSPRRPAPDRRCSRRRGRRKRSARRSGSRRQYDRNARPRSERPLEARSRFSASA